MADEWQECLRDIWLALFEATRDDLSVYSSCTEIAGIETSYGAIPREDYVMTEWGLRNTSTPIALLKSVRRGTSAEPRHEWYVLTLEAAQDRRAEMAATAAGEEG